MPIAAANRVKIILDLMRDGVVANETPYASLDLADNPKFTKYTNGVWTTLGPGTAVNPAAPTAAEKARFFLTKLSEWTASQLHSSRVPVAANAAAAAEAAAVAAEVATEIAVQDNG